MTAKTAPDVWDDPKTIFSLTKRTGDFIETQTKAGHPWFVQLSHYAVHLKISYRQATLDGLKDRPVGKKHAVPEFAAMTEDLDVGIGELMARLTVTDIFGNISKPTNAAIPASKPTESITASPAPAANGLSYRYLEGEIPGEWMALPNFAKLTPVRQGSVAMPGITLRLRRHFPLQRTLSAEQDTPDAAQNMAGSCP